MGRNDRLTNSLPPHLPVRHAIGVDISDVSAELLELQGDRGHAAVGAFSHVDLPPGVVTDGEVLDPDRLVALLRAGFAGARPRPFRTRAAIVSLPESKVYLRAFEFPRTLTEDQVRRAARFEAEGALPLTLDEVYNDVLFHRSRVESQHVLFAASPRRVVDAYVKVLPLAGLSPIAFEVESEALARAIVPPSADPVVVADIGGRATVISVVEREAVHSTVTVPVAGEAVTERIALALGIPREDAEQRKRAEGIAPGAPAALRDAITDILQPILDELRRTAQYHEAHTGRTVLQVFLAGGSAQLPGLAPHLSAALRLPASVGDPWETKAIELPAALPESDRAALHSARGAFATVVGLALRGVAREPAAAGVNLLPPSFKEPILAWRSTLAASALAALAAATLLGLAGFAGGSAFVRHLGVRQTAADAARVRTQVLGERFQAAAAEAAAVNEELRILGQFAAGRPDVAGFLAALRGALPAGITLQEVSVKVPPEASAAYTVTLVGLADRREIFLTLEGRLKTLQGVRRVDSPLSNLNVREHAPFSVTLTVNHP